ncbi:MAG: RND transporter [Desulfuromonadales bacterium]|nr:RND transporter [Desulfuromonadales bacterium]NIR33976.1 RND transporter [Desulfuromonadales bacterium]NIS42648.1 RND transporter [Desulfuromonadales bacterium]
MAVLVGLAPLRPEPHLVEKLRLLLEGQPLRGIDIFDLLFHAFPLGLLLLKALTERPRLKRAKR